MGSVEVNQQLNYYMKFDNYKSVHLSILSEIQPSYAWCSV